MFTWLQDYQKLKRQIEYTEHKLNNSKAELKRWLYGDLSNVSLTKGSLAADLEKHIERDEKILDTLNERKEKLIKFIKTFDDLDSQILFKKYIEGKNLYVISEELEYSYSHIRQCHARLVKTVELIDKHILEYLP